MTTQKMLEFLIASWLLVFGHILGDYGIQWRKLAIAKGTYTKEGYFACLLHCALYTISVWVMFLPLVLLVIVSMPPFGFFLFVFASHFVMDKWSIAQRWLDLIKGRNVLTAYREKAEYWEIDVAFSAIVYTVLDNGIHYIAMWFALLVMGGYLR